MLLSYEAHFIAGLGGLRSKVRGDGLLLSSGSLLDFTHLLPIERCGALSAALVSQNEALIPMHILLASWQIMDNFTQI